MPAPPVKKRRAFISYARKDGTETAQRLHDLLASAGHEVLLDTDRIAAGSSWSSVIEDALDGCDTFIAVLTEGSYVSELCRAEQMLALRSGKLVIPVVAKPGAPRPLYFHALNYRIFPAQQQELLADLDAEGPYLPEAVVTRLRYDTVPTLPQNFIPRQQAVEQLRATLFTEGEKTSIAVTAVAGMGGVGKSALATALCRDPVVQAAFPDGIAWITIGREWKGDFVPLMRQVARALGEDFTAYDNPLACANQYRNVLREKAALVVVDDVWNVEHVRPLLIDAPRSRFLLTTRDAGIARAVGARHFSADLLSESEGRELLARWVGMTVADLPVEADRILRACGQLAFAVAQVGAILRNMDPNEWRDTLHALESADVSGIEDRLPSGQASFFKSLATSIEALSKQMQERYLKLAILLENVPAPLVVLQTLWKVSESEGRRTARYFVDRSLATWATGEPALGIKLHDLQLDYVRARFDDQAALHLIHGALRLSAHVLGPHPEEFASQMIGRLLPYVNVTAISEFISEVSDGAPGLWLRPLWSSLVPPERP